MNASGCKTRFASTQIARRVRIIAQWQIHRAYANTRKGVIAMFKRANGRPVPNNPAKAYELGRLDGTKQCMDNVSCVLLDKLGFHVREETADEHDTRIAWNTYSSALWSWWRPKTTDILRWRTSKRPCGANISW